jgi:DNA-binding NarL/FixJ family response regulator
LTRYLGGRDLRELPNRERRENLEEAISTGTEQHDTPEARTRAMAGGADGYLVKPVDDRVCRRHLRCNLLRLS